MIRPITVMCWILALSAGLYLYRAKHEVELMDQQIDRIAKQTADLRAQSRRLLDDWIRLGEPEQLHKYSDEYLGLKTIAPAQFARLSDLPGRMAAPMADPPAGQPPADQPDVVAQSADVPDAGTAVAAAGETASAATRSPGAGDTDSVNEANADDLPVPPIPPTVVPVTAISFPAVTAPPLQARPVTPRVAAAPPDADAERSRAAAPARIVEEPRAAPAKAAPVALGEPRSSPAITPTLGTKDASVNVPAAAKPSAPPSVGMPPLQANGPRNVPGLPPLQAQASTSDVAAGVARGTPRPVRELSAGTAPEQAAYRPADSRGADIRPAEPRREARPMPVQAPYQTQPPYQNPPYQAQAQSPRQAQGPVQAQVLDRGSPPQIARQAPPQQSGSVLGMSRGSVPLPLPLPAPTPVNATWNPSGSPNGSGR